MELKEDSMEERIRSWVFDDKKTLDYKSLSHIFKVHVNVMKQHLFTLASKESSELTVRYSLAGTDSEGNLRVALVFQEDLQSSKDSLASLSSLSVHSLARKGHYHFSPSIGDASLDGQTGKSYNSIRNKSALLKATAVAVLDAANPKEEHQDKPSKSIKEFKIQLKKEPKEEESKEDKPLTEIKTKLSSKAPPMKGLVGMWEKAAEKKAAEKENRINEKKEESKAKPKRQKTASSSSSQSKKRKRVQVFSDSESEHEENEEEKEDALRSLETDSVIPKVESEDSEDEIPATPTITEPVPHKKRKVRKEVTKQYRDEEGYMVTKKEFELQSEEEDDNTKDEAAKCVKPIISKPSKAASPKKIKQQLKNNKQASIMNFFMKK